MYQLRQWLITIVSAFPFARMILKGLYLLAIKGAANLREQHPEIVNILLMSNLDDKNFVYGQSDLNIVIIIQDNAHPKEALGRIRKSLRQSWPANVLIDMNRLPILKESEIKTPIIRSHLVTSTTKGQVNWNSIVNQDDVKFKAGHQGYFAKHYFYFQRLEKFLSKDISPNAVSKHYIRSYGKNVTRALEGLSRDDILPEIKDEKWKRYSRKLFSFNPFARLYFNSHRERSWRILDTNKKKSREVDLDLSMYPERLLEFADELCYYDIVEDVFITPSLLQNSEKAKGKAFIDVVVGGFKKEINKKDLKIIQRMIDDFLDLQSKEEEPLLKYEFEITTIGMLRIRHERGLFHYPLEGWYRRQRTLSVRKRVYDFKVKKDCVEQSMIHFLLIQFMSFRSQKLSSSLIGSKFMKSLNLMNRYQLILDYLEEKDMEIPEKFSDMMANVTPQLGHYRPDIPVQEEDWPLVKSQLVYSLKKIRDKLSEKKPSLKNLQF